MSHCDHQVSGCPWSGLLIMWAERSRSVHESLTEQMVDVSVARFAAGSFGSNRMRSKSRQCPLAASSDLPHSGVVRVVETATWGQIVAVMPWLGQLPPVLVARIDLTEFVVPSGHVACAPAGRAGDRCVRHDVPTNKPTAAPGWTQLCQVIEPAELDATALAALLRAESHLAGAGVSLCAYARPLCHR